MPGEVTEESGRATRTDKIGVCAGTDIVFPTSKTPRSAVHTDRQNRYRRLQGGQFRE